MGKRKQDFFNAFVNFLLIPFDFFNVSFVDVTRCVELFGNLVFAVGYPFHFASQLTEFRHRESN